MNLWPICQPLDKDTSAYQGPAVFGKIGSKTQLKDVFEKPVLSDQTAAVEDQWAQLVSFASHICMPMCATGQLATDEHANVALSMHRWCEAALLLATFHCSIAICA